MFDQHPAVLGGINECIIALDDLQRPLAELGDHICTRAFMRSQEGWGEDPVIDCERSTWVEGHDLDRFRSTDGAIALQIRVDRPVPVAPPLIERVLLEAGDYAALLDDQPAALSRLAVLLPAEYVDRPFPGAEQSKFELLNGWQAPIEGAPGRRAYRRARWFLGRPFTGGLTFEVRRPSGAAAAAATLTVSVNGEERSVSAIDAEWSAISVGLPPNLGEVFVCELQLRLDPSIDNPAFEDLVFEVRGRGVAPPPAPRAKRRSQARRLAGKFVRQSGLVVVANGALHWARWGEDPIARLARRFIGPTSA